MRIIKALPYLVVSGDDDAKGSIRAGVSEGLAGELRAMEEAGVHELQLHNVRMSEYWRVHEEKASVLPRSERGTLGTVTVSAGVDLLKGNRSQQTQVGNNLGEPLPTGADNRKSDNPSGRLVEQSGAKGAKRPEIKRYSAHSQQQGPRAKRLDMTQSEPALTNMALGGKQSLAALSLTPVPRLAGRTGSQSPQEVIEAGFCELCHMTHSAATWKALSQRIER